MRITEFQIDRYGPLHLPRTECDGGLEVFYGPNESGKTLLLEAMLRLLEPDMPSVMGELDRVADSPAGYLVLESDGATYQVGDDRVLADIAPVTPDHLRNVFVVRDNDLRIRQHHDFYDSVTEQIGDLHTSEIEAIQDRLEELGRLTSRRRNISSAAEYDHASDVRDGARQLADAIRGYNGTARADGLDDLERELIDVQSRLRRGRSELEALARAEVAQDHERLSSRLETAERLEADHDDVADFTRGTLEALTELEAGITSSETQIANLQSQIGGLHDENDRLQREITALESELRPLGERAAAIDEVDDSLGSYRDTSAETTGAVRRMRVTRLVALLGVGFGGAATLYGVVQGQPQLFLPLLLLALGFGSGLVWYRDHRRVTAVERNRTALLETARDAGLSVDDVADVAPAVTAFRTELEAMRGQIDERRHEIDVNEGLISDHSATIDDHRGTIDEHRAEKGTVFEEAEVTTIEAYRTNVEERESIETDLGPAKQSLIDAFGEPEIEDAAFEFWRKELETMVSDVELDDVDPSDYDDERHNELEQVVANLGVRADDLRAALDDHRHKLEEFNDRASDLNATPFIERQLQLRARSVDGLSRLADDLDALAARIERDGEVSRVALEVFDDLHRAEEDKITDLFEPGGRASEVFGAITDERYRRVEYDPDDRALIVHRDNGSRHAASELSQGTRDQLYLAARISLAEQLLETEPGFFLMDDAFLPADRDRLDAGFRVLEQLVEDGWQVIYLTAKEEVGVEMVDELGLRCSELEELP